MVRWSGARGWIVVALTLCVLAARVQGAFGDHEALLDPLLPFQWSLKNTGQEFPSGCTSGVDCLSGTPGADLGWSPAYDAGFTGQGVVIAIANPTNAPTVRCANPDLAGRLWTNTAELAGIPGFDDDGNGYVDDIHGTNFAGPPDPNDPNGAICAPGVGSNHDTAVARLALGEANSSQGVGVAPEAKLMVLVYAGDVQNRRFYEDVLGYAQDNGADVLMVPYQGVPVMSSCIVTANAYGLDRTAILFQSNVLVIFGRPGNDPIDPNAPSWPAEYPACDSSALGLAHTDENDVSQVRSVFVDFAVPGGRADSFNQPEASWAIGYTAGAAALLLEQDPAASRTDLIDRLMNTTDQVGATPYVGGRNDEYGTGRLNVFNALNVGDIDLDGVPGDGDLSWRVGDAPCNGGSSACDDNCPLEPNPGQLDSGGIDSLAADGIGDACQCGDPDRDGAVLAADVTLLREYLAGLPAAPDLAYCNVTGPPGGPSECKLDDVVVLQRALAAQLPGVAQLCSPALP